MSFARKKLGRSLISVILIHSMFCSYAFGANDNSKDQPTWSKTIINQFTQSAQQTIQAKAQGLAAIASQQVEADTQSGKYNLKTSPALPYFPECKVPQARQDFPMNACLESSSMSEDKALNALAQQNLNQLEILRNETVLTPGIGLKCVDDQFKKFKDKMIEMQNNIERLKTDLTKQSEVFREQNKRLLSDLEDTNAELFGSSDSGSGKANKLKAKTRDFTKEISPSCQGVIGPEMANAKAKGLNGLFESVAPTNKAAVDFNVAKGQIEDELRKSIMKIKNSIGDDGFDNWMAGDQSTLLGSSYPALTEYFNKEKGNLEKQKKRIISDLKNLGFSEGSLPLSFDKGGSAQLQTFISGSQDYFKKKFINDCALSSGGGANAIDFDKLLSSLSQPSTKNSEAALSAYKLALQNIINKDNMLLSDKLDAIKALDQRIQGVKVNYMDGGANSVFESPSQLISKTISLCDQKFSEDSTFLNNGNAKMGSPAQNAKKAQALLQEYKNWGDSAPSKIYNNLIDSVLNCNGESKKATDKCSSDTIDASKSGFCMKKASTCSVEILSCYTELQAKKTVREMKVKNLANAFNNNVQTMVNNSNALLNSQKKAITDLTKSIQQRFPNSNFKIPEDMLVALPSLSSDKFGVALAGDGDIDKFIKDLPNQMNNLKKMLDDQLNNSKT
jgi:hypothetical protein